MPNVDLSKSDIVFVYSRFMSNISDLEAMKSIKPLPVSKANINQEIKRLSSVTDKIRDQYPGLAIFDDL
jgi:hypothetical protein